MGKTFETEVRLQVESWMRWLPKWQPSSGLSRSRICRKCTGSPLVAAAGFPEDTPHTVRHALVMRLHRIINEEMDTYIHQNLPLMFQELKHDEERRKRLPYRPTEGLSPEFEGLELDPPTAPDQPYLFTMSELASQLAETSAVKPQPALSQELKNALKRELELSDRYMATVGNQICQELAKHQHTIQRAFDEFVEPQIEELMRELTEQLSFPPGI